MPESRHRRSRSERRTARAATAIPINRPKRKTNKIYLIASIVIAVLVIASFGLTSIIPGGGQIETGSARAYEEGVGVQNEVMPTRSHVPEGETVEYSTTPPTSGDHWEIPQSCGFYPGGLPDERIVHNLEHGNIVVSYNLDSALEEELRKAADDIDLSQNWGVLRYYPDIAPGTVALTTWGVSDIMEGVDKDRIDKFFETYAGVLGPEFLPCTGNQVAMPSSQP